MPGLAEASRVCSSCGAPPRTHQEVSVFAPVRCRWPCQRIQTGRCAIAVSAQVSRVVSFHVQRRTSALSNPTATAPREMNEPLTSANAGQGLVCWASSPSNSGELGPGAHSRAFTGRLRPDQSVLIAGHPIERHAHYRAAQDHRHRHAGSRPVRAQYQRAYVEPDEYRQQGRAKGLSQAA